MYQSVLNECKRDTSVLLKAAAATQKSPGGKVDLGFDLPCPLPPPTRLSTPTPDVIRPRRPQSAGGPSGLSGLKRPSGARNNTRNSTVSSLRVGTGVAAATVASSSSSSPAARGAAGGVAGVGAGVGIGVPVGAPQGEGGARATVSAKAAAAAEARAADSQAKSGIAGVAGIAGHLVKDCGSSRNDCSNEQSSKLSNQDGVRTGALEDFASLPGRRRPSSPPCKESILTMKLPARPTSAAKCSGEVVPTRPSTASTSCSARPSSANSTSRPGRHRLPSARRKEEATNSTVDELVSLRPRSSSLVDRESRINDTIQRLLHWERDGPTSGSADSTNDKGNNVDKQDNTDNTTTTNNSNKDHDNNNNNNNNSNNKNDNNAEPRSSMERDKNNDNDSSGFESDEQDCCTDQVQAMLCKDSKQEKSNRQQQGQPQQQKQQQKQQRQQQLQKEYKPTRKSKSPVCKIRAIGDEFRIHNAHMVVLARKFQNRKLANKIAAFDRRWVPSAGIPRLDFKSISRVEENSSRAPSKGRSEAPSAPTHATRPASVRSRTLGGARSVFASSSGSGLLGDSVKETLGEGLKDCMAAIGLEREEQVPDEDGLYQVHYLIERQSSQHFDHLAVNLTDPSGLGSWQSAGQNVGGCVKNESLTFNLEFGPHTVSGVEFRIAETMSSPRRCRVQFSLDNALGPWQDAWNFIVSSPGARKVFKSSYDYAKNRTVFAAAVVEIFGSIERAWQALTANNTENLKKSSLGTFFQKLHHEIGRDRGNPAKRAAAARVLSMDHKVLFRELDTDNEGYVTAEQLFWETPKPPTASYWRLLICDTWGGTPYVSIGGPLHLLSDTPQATPKGERRRTFAKPALGEDDPDSPKAQALRQELAELARKYDLRPLEVQDIYGEFSAVDTDGGGTVSREEFRDLLLKVFRLADAETLTASRQDYYWKMVCPRPHKDEIEFEDLLQFCVQLGTNYTSGIYGRQDPHLAELSQALSQRLHNRLSSGSPRAL